MSFIHEDFLLQSKTARRLYHSYAEDQPILDYHCHLPPRDLAANRRFENVFEIWLEGDHYKWRAMRANGVSEELITGNASPHDKFLAWAATVPQTLRNPLFHWTHLELKRYFGIDVLLDESTAGLVWNLANEQLKGEDLRAWSILQKFRVSALCTTDDPTDDLAWHSALAASPLRTRVLPTFRPDKALNVHQPAAFNEWVARLEASSNTAIGGFTGFLDALKSRHDYFHSLGGRLSDHGLNHCFASFCSRQTAGAIFDKVRRGGSVAPSEHAQFATYLMVYFGQLDAGKGWTKQIHLGAQRSNNTRMTAQLGADTGLDSIGDWNQLEALGAYLDVLDRDNLLPKMVLYNLNPADNYAFATMAGNFMDGRTPGKIQFGSGWWYLDQKEAMEWQMNALSNCGLLSRFIGMLTDSRSFMSYPRHEYFRRVLCNLIGDDVEKGLLPDSDDLLGPLVGNICHENARRFLDLPV
jgi:glucuronate isomerase